VLHPAFLSLSLPLSLSSLSINAGHRMRDCQKYIIIHLLQSFIYLNQSKKKNIQGARPGGGGITIMTLGVKLINKGKDIGS
jgi:hypothetical protein